MFRLSAELKVYLHREPIDFRAGINSLAVLVQEEMELDPFAPAVFVFCNRRRDRMKLLFFDRSGFVMVLKRLTEDRFRWPRREVILPGNILLADRAYDSDTLRDTLKSRGAWGCIRPMPNRASIPVFSPSLYKQRNAVERFFNKLKQFRAVATRYEKRDDNFLASVQLASIRIWLRSYESVT